MTMRILVTGGAGFIGSALVRHALSMPEHRVLVVDKLTYAGHLDNLEPVKADPRLSFVQADIADEKRMREVIFSFRPQAIVHLAAESHVDRSIDTAAPFVHSNVVGTFALLEAALAYWRACTTDEREAFRFHHVSTDEVFGALGADGRFVETSPYRPNSPYSATKAAADHLVRAWGHTYGLPFVLSTCCNNFGPYQFPEKLVPLTILNALEGKRLPVYGTGLNVRDWLYVEDHARALLLIATKGRVGETYNVGADCERTNLQVVGEICRVMDEIRPDASARCRADLIDFVADRPGHDFRYAVDATKIRTELGWHPQETFESGLRKTIVWFLENRKWCRVVRDRNDTGERLNHAAAHVS